MRPGFLYLRQKRVRRTLECFQAQTARRLRGVERPLRREQGQDPEPGGGLCPVDEGQPLLFSQIDGLESELSEYLTRVANLAIVLDPPLTDQPEGYVRQRSKVPAGSHRPDSRNDGVYPVIQQFQQEVDQLFTATRIAAGKGVRPEDHDRPHLLGGHRLAHAGRVTAHQVALQVALLIGRNDDLRKTAESGGHAVDALPTLQQLLDEVSSTAHPGAGLLRQ